MVQTAGICCKKIIVNGGKWWEMVGNGGKWWEMVGNGWEMVGKCSEWVNGAEGSGMLQNGEDGWYMVQKGLHEPYGKLINPKLTITKFDQQKIIDYLTMTELLFF